jgi:hypothetical protein
MAKTRFESFAKKDRDWIERWAAIHTEIRQDVGSVLAERLVRFIQEVTALASRPPAPGNMYTNVPSLFASEMFFLSSRVLQSAIARRLLDDNPRDLRDAVFLSARLDYLSDLAKTPAYSGGYDCLHVFELLRAYAVNDRQLAAAYLKRHPGPAKNGHPFTKLLCNSITAILSNAPNVSSFPELLRRRRDNGYDHALLRGVGAIIEGDRALVTESLMEMLAAHRRQTIDDAMLKYFPVQAHGLFNLAADAMQTRHNQPPPDRPEHPLWDAEFQALTSGNLDDDDLEILGRFSPRLVTLARTLPSQINAEGFAALVTPKGPDAV